MIAGPRREGLDSEAARDDNRSWFHFGTIMVSQMPNITLKNIPARLYAQLRRRAAGHRRSINSEILVCLERSLGGRPIDPDEFLAGVDSLRERLGLPHLTDEEMRRAQSEGRP